MKVLLAFVFSFLSFSNCQDLDIITLVDMSGSVGGSEQFIKEAVRQLSFQREQDHFGVIRFDSYATTVAPLGTPVWQTRGLISSMDDAAGSTNMKDAFYLAVEEFKLRGRKQARKVIVIISDGVPDDEDTCLIIANQMQAVFNIDVFCVLVAVSSHDAEYMEQLGTSFDTNYKELYQTLKEINFCL
jgi:Mg-chelatase subunit ChlD